MSRLCNLAAGMPLPVVDVLQIALSWTLTPGRGLPAARSIDRLRNEGTGIAGRGHAAPVYHARFSMQGRARIGQSGGGRPAGRLDGASFSVLRQLLRIGSFIRAWVFEIDANAYVCLMLHFKAIMFFYALLSSHVLMSQFPTPSAPHPPNYQFPPPSSTLYYCCRYRDLYVQRYKSRCPNVVAYAAYTCFRRAGGAGRAGWGGWVQAVHQRERAPTPASAAPGRGGTAGRRVRVLQADGCQQPSGPLLPREPPQNQLVG